MIIVDPFRDVQLRKMLFQTRTYNVQNIYTYNINKYKITKM